MYSLRTFLLKTKSILLFALIFLAIGLDCETYLINKQSQFLKQGISSPAFAQLDLQGFLEEIEEADNEALYFEKSDFSFYQYRYAKFRVFTYKVFSFQQFFIQNHLLNLPPPIS